jgi:undecaprenyl diphosphate synthase
MKNPAHPAHVAIIMDGNGRWAQARGLLRVSGHEAGVDSVRAVTEECARLHLEQLTLYAFSSENWKRPRYEILTLMHQLERFLEGERDTIMRNDVRLTAIGDEERLPTNVRRALNVTRSMTADNKGLNLCLALSYGGRQEIVAACKAIARKVAAGEIMPDKITEQMIAGHLYQPDMREPDLVIRTGGELRISNFLLWQISYSELYVTPTLWPDFREADLHAAFASYAGRERRFGGLVDRLKA